MSRTISITYKGVTKNLTEWAEFFGVTKGAIPVRMREHNETHEQAISYFAHRSPSAARQRVNTKTSLNLLAEILAELKSINKKLEGANNECKSHDWKKSQKKIRRERRQKGSRR